MKEADIKLIEKAINGPVDDATMAVFDKAEVMAERIGTTLGTKDKLLLAAMCCDIVQAGVQEGDAVKVIYKGEERAGTVVSIAKLSEAGKIRVKIDGDKAKYRELPASDVSQ